LLASFTLCPTPRSWFERPKSPTRLHGTGLVCLRSTHYKGSDGVEAKFKDGWIRLRRLCRYSIPTHSNVFSFHSLSTARGTQLGRKSAGLCNAMQRYIRDALRCVMMNELVAWIACCSRWIARWLATADLKLRAAPLLFLTA